VELQDTAHVYLNIYTLLSLSRRRWNLV